MIEKIKEKKLIIFWAVVFILLNYLSYYFRFTYNMNILPAFNNLFSEPQLLLRGFPISFNIADLSISFFTTCILFLIWKEKKDNRERFKRGEEHGSAKWGNVKKINNYISDSKNELNNFIISQNLEVALDDSDKPFEYRINKNGIVIGGSGSGKTRCYVKPNLLQCNSSFVCTDPKGTIINETGYALRKKKYKLKVFNTVDFSKSMKYNPLVYIRKEQDILSLVETIIANTDGSKASEQKQDFWVKAEKLLYQAYISLIVTKFPKEEQHLGTLIDLVRYSTVREDDEDFKNAIDLLFDKLEEEDPEHFAVKQYRAFKLSAGKTTKSILISCAARLSPLNIPDFRELISEDDLDFESLGDKGQKTGLFVVISDTDPTFNFIVSIMYSQMFNRLCFIADNKYKGSLPTHVRFVLDEFANIGLIPNFEKLIATIRSRNISATVILQALSQLKVIYKDSWETIVGCCDTTIFLGGKEDSTVKKLSEDLGKETIYDENVSITRSNSSSSSKQNSKLGVELMAKNKLLTMSKKKCIVQVLGYDPVIDDKFELEKHRLFQYHSKGNQRWFDLGKYISHFNNSKVRITTV